MNTQDELKTLKEIVAGYDVLKQRISELEEQEQEFPQDGDEYWFVTANGRVSGCLWDKDDFDLRVQEMGNTFKTKEQAEFAVEKLKVEAELQKFSRPFVWGKENWYLGMDNNRDIFLEYDNYEVYHGVTYFENKNKVKEAIEAVGEERIKKYIFGMEG